MKITNEIPTDWRNLQDLVCKYLNQAGYSAEVAKTIDTVRGKVEVDVFATAKNELLKKFICECKFWETAVPKEKIHAFRTQVQDCGAMVGIFISTAGYQSGAIEAANYSNVLLKDWDGFIELIANQWIHRRVIRLKNAYIPLSVYSDFLGLPNDFGKCPGEMEGYRELHKKYASLYLVIGGFVHGFVDGSEDVFKVDDVEFRDYNSLFNYLETKAMEAKEDYDHLFSRCPIDPSRFESRNDGIMTFYNNTEN